MADPTTSTAAPKKSGVTTLKDVVHPADMEANSAEPPDQGKVTTVTMAGGTKVTGPEAVVKRLAK